MVSSPTLNCLVQVLSRHPGVDIKPASNAIAIVLTGRQSVFAARSTTIMDPLTVGYMDANPNPSNPMYPTVAMNIGFTGLKNHMYN